MNPVTQQPMPAADAAWLHMDRPTNPMVVNGLIRLGGVPDLEDVLEVIDLRLVGRFPRFRQRVVERRGRTPAFADDPGFDLRRHVERAQRVLEDLWVRLLKPEFAGDGHHVEVAVQPEWDDLLPLLGSEAVRHDRELVARAEFLEVHGVGQKKLEEYGEAFLAEILRPE